MIYLLAAFVGLVSAQKDKTCLANVLAGVPGKVFEASDAIAEINALENDIRKCKVQLGNCDGGGGNQQTKKSSGGSMAFVVKYGAKQFAFAITDKYPIGAAYDQVHAEALAKLEIDDDHDLTFDYAFTNPKVGGKVRDDENLEEAINMAISFGAHLVLTAHKTTLAPTPEPTEPWGTIRYIKQVFGSIADGRDNGQPNGRTMKFTKVSAADNTVVRLHYEDNLRVHNNGCNCYWELYVDGKRCPTGWIRGAMHSSGNQNNDHQTSSIIGTCGNIAPGGRTFAIHLYGNNRDCYTGWDPESKGVFLMEVKEVKQGMYGYYGLTDRNKVRGEDNMFPILGRQLSFTKKDPNSQVRLIYQDNFRVHGGGSCRWYLRVDDKICPGNKYIASSIHTRAGDNDHLPQAFTGYCNGLTAGNHVLKAGVQGSNDCYTGWESSFYLEAMEMSVGEGKMVPAYLMRTGNNADGRDNGWVNWRTLNFKKAQAADKTVLRLLYSDVLRVHGHGKWCKWEIRIDDKACAANLSGSRYVAANHDDHTPGQILGYCTGIAAGAHNMKIHVRGNGADCYTGWDRQSQGSFLMEVQELDIGTVQGLVIPK